MYFFFIWGRQTTSELLKLNGIIQVPIAQGQNWLLMDNIHVDAYGLIQVSFKSNDTQALTPLETGRHH